MFNSISKDWLILIDNHLRYHPTMRDASNPMTVTACEVCRHYVWEREKGEG